MSEPSGTSKTVSISWYAHHRRSSELASDLGVEPYFVYHTSRNVAIRYMRQWTMTTKILRATSPEVVVVMQPPAVALAPVYLASRRAGFRIVGDLHSGTFLDRKWRWATSAVMRVLRSCGGAIVPNNEIAEMCAQYGVRAFVYQAGAQIVVSDGSAQELDANAEHRRTVFAPLTYADDEPIQQIIEAARADRTLTWVLTGRAPQQLRNTAPDNVVFAGFMPRDEYTAALRSAGTVLALTSRDSTLQSAGFEALAAGVPLVTSPTRVLREFFGDAAIYSSSDSTDIRTSVTRAVSQYEVLSDRMKSLRQNRADEHDAVRERLSTFLGSLGGRQ